jgi:hypothetical protein
MRTGKGGFLPSGTNPSESYADWRRLWPAARELNNLNLADFTLVDCLLHCRMVCVSWVPLTNPQRFVSDAGYALVPVLRSR